MLFNENNKLVEGTSNKIHGSGVYPNKMWKCSKCGKTYPSYGALKFYHTKERCKKLWGKK